MMQASEPTRLSRPGVGDTARLEILEAAAEEFMRLGYDAASIDAIADRLQSTKGRVYHYYRSKADLYLDVQAEANEIAWRRVRTVADAPATTATSRLRAMGREHVLVIIDHFAMQRVSVQGIERGAGPQPRTPGFEHVVRLRDRYEALFVDAITAGIATGELRQIDPQRVVKPFLGALSWTVMWYRPAEESRDDRTRLADELADFAVRGVLAG